ncbi:hypothetical protein G6F32_014403 [Rhizopus arrhizus]|nr:hypothetical protein G6F32_014403 [Rhizopus arrhizus]
MRNSRSWCPPRPRRPQPRQRAAEAAPGQHRDHHNHGPHQHQPMLRHALEGLFHQQIGHRTADRTQHIAQAADHHHDDQFARHRPRHVAGRGEGRQVGQQQPGDAGQHARGHIRRQPHAEPRIAQRGERRSRSMPRLAASSSPHAAQ